MKSIHRLEECDDGDRLTAITTSWFNLAAPSEQNILTREYPSLFTHTTSREKIKVGSAIQHPDSGKSEIHGRNAFYADVELRERELTDAEREWCENTIMYQGDGQPDSIYEFEIPHPERLREYITERTDHRPEDVTAVIENHDVRHDLLTTFQERIEEERFRTTQLRSRKGGVKDLHPEWDPEYTDDSREELKDYAFHRKDAYQQDFKDVAGFRYMEFFSARLRSLGFHEPNLKPRDIVALDVVDRGDWTYCRECGGVFPEDYALHVQLDGYEDGRTLRVCDYCVDRNILEKFTDDAIADAKDERAQRTGGQRRITANYADPEE